MKRISFARVYIKWFEGRSVSRGLVVKIHTLPSGKGKLKLGLWKRSSSQWTKRSWEKSDVYFDSPVIGSDSCAL